MIVKGLRQLRYLRRFLRLLSLYLRTLGIGGSLSALQAAVRKQIRVVTMRRPEIRTPIHLRIPTSDVPTYEQVFVLEEYDFAIHRAPRVIVDAGANIGLASIYFANRYPDAKIVAIEPEASNFELLKLNVAPYPNVVPVQAALWHENSTIQLVDPSLGNWGFMTRSKDGAEGAAETAAVKHEVRSMTVSAVMTEHDIEYIDILKIDIEGAEKEVFATSGYWIDKVGSLIIELHERMKPGCNRAFYCGSNGFDHEWLQGENVVLARSDGCLARAA